MGLSAFFQSSILTINDPTNLNGILGNFQPTGIEFSGNYVSGWKNEVTGTVMTVNRANFMPYLAADSDFNGLPSAAVNQSNYFAGLSVAATAGYTVITVNKYRNSGTGGGTMLWSFGSSGGIVDLWSGSSSNAGRYLNSLNGDQFGFGISDGTANNTEILSAKIPITNQSTNSILYRNGIAKSFNINAGPAVNKNLASVPFYPGWLSAQSQYAFDGKLSTVLIYNRFLSTSELDAIHAFLKTTYNIA